MSQKETDFLEDMTKADEAAPPAEPETADSEKVEKGESAPEAKAQPEKAADPQKEPEKKVEAPPASKDPEMVPFAGLKAERQKRQEWERKARDLETQLQAKQQQPAPAFFEAPEQYVQHLVQQTEVQANQRLMAALDAQARDAYSDYDEVVAYLTEQAAGNPALAQQVFNAPNPAVAAYKLGKQLQEMERMKDPDAYRAQLEAELRAKWEAEQKSKVEAKAKAAAEIPPDLATARNATAATQPPSGTVFDNLFTG